MYDLCAIGDALVDFIPAPQYTPENPVYQCEAGGTVANLLTAGSKLGLNTVFVGKIGADCMGELVRNKMQGCGVSMEGCVMDPMHFTTQSFVSLGENGERSFSFCRSFGADIWLKEDEIPMKVLEQSSMLGFSGMCMTDDPVRQATWTLLRAAKRINYRDKLWQNEKEMIHIMRETLSYVTLYKSSEEEAFLLTGTEDLRKAAKIICGFGCRDIIITLGQKGAYFYSGGKDGLIPAYRVEAVDTTGAGDSFFAAVLHQIVQRGGIEKITGTDYSDILKFANGVGALATTKRGGIKGSPTLREAEEFLKLHNNEISS
ncbi:carbohydrate kinase [Muricomes intestini]|uniref:carbohydrate kinase family protein n=1 Tax=Muricomes intestini TaxID=1796634 RepID=UPI002FE11557